jgi:hypothetical protein
MFDFLDYYHLWFSTKSYSSFYILSFHQYLNFIFVANMLGAAAVFFFFFLNLGCPG